MNAQHKEHLGSQCSTGFKHYVTRPFAHRQPRSRLFAIMVGAFLLLFLGISPVRANTITVNTTAPGILSDGFCSLIEAIENADDTTTGQPHTDCAVGNPSGADTINLTAVTYTLTNVFQTDSTGSNGLPLIDTAITIEGNNAIITRDASAPNFRILKVTGTGNLTMNNLTISGGRITDYGGGGIYSLGTLTLNNTTLSGNIGTSGGALENDGGLATLNNCIVSSNTAVHEGGGGIWNNAAGIMTINNCLISNNTINEAVGYVGNGGGMVNAAYFGNIPQLTINNSTISGNSTNLDTATSQGGGIYNSGGQLDINQSTINNNTAKANGGGIYSGSYSDTEINHSTISQNIATSGSGGGIQSSALGGNNNLTLNYVTLTGNLAATNGGGLSSSSSLAIAIVEFNRTLVSGNTALTGREVYNSSIATANNFNLFGYSSIAGLDGLSAGATDIVPGLGVPLASIIDTTLANNGVNPHPDSHALPSGSPAIDAIPTTDPACNPPIITDQRGAARANEANGPNQGGSACDIGAFELASQTPTAVSLQSITAQARTSGWITAVTAAGLLALASGGWLLRPSRQRKPNG
jgi:hypothetical protein